MDDLTHRLRRLGKMLSEVSDRTAEQTTLSNARRRWLSTSGKHAAVAAEKKSGGWWSPWRRRRTVIAVAFAAAAGLALFLFLLRPQGRAISFAVGAKAELGAPGEWVAPEGQTPLDLRFSEGTVVTVLEGARIRVTETTENGAALLIENGSILAAIKHPRSGTKWTVRAGPYEVGVTGTSFEAKWDPAKETFDLVMLEGSVVVSGPRLPADRPIVAGEHLTVSSGHMELRAGAALRQSATAEAGALSAAPSDSNVPSSPSPTASAAAAGSSAPQTGPTGSAQPVSFPVVTVDSSWKTLAKAGKYKEAMALVEKSGFATEAAKSSSSDLLALADVARFSGRPGQAKDALLLARQRGARGLTAFLLGKVAADQLRSPGEAVTWFETYLQEASGGALAEQALGRILEIRKRDPGAAKVTAQRYLSRYPNGAYAAVAKSLLEGKSKTDTTEPPRGPSHPPKK